MGHPRMHPGTPVMRYWDAVGHSSSLWELGDTTGLKPQLDLYGAPSWISMEHPVGFLWGIPISLLAGDGYFGVGYGMHPGTMDGMLLAAHHCHRPQCRGTQSHPHPPTASRCSQAGRGWSQHPWVGARCPAGPTHPFPAPSTPPWAGWRCQTPAQASVGLTLSEAQEP